MERRSVSSDNGSAGAYDAGNQLYCFNQEAKAFTPEIYSERSLQKAKKRALSLPVYINFFQRFRLRIISQNISSYAVLLFGILFANLLLIFGLLTPSALAHYRDYIEHHMLSEYQYILKIPAEITSVESEWAQLINAMLYQSSIETENKDAEKFSAYTLSTLDGSRYKIEDITLYGGNDGDG